MIRRTSEKDLPQIAALHDMILPDSIFARLGRNFLEQYYHAMLMKQDDIFSCVYMQDGKVAGFIVMASSGRKFYAHIWRGLLPLLWALMKTLVARPASINEMLKAAAFLMCKNRLIKCQAGGELLQIAVHPDYRVKSGDNKETDFFRRTGHKIAEELFLKAIVDLKGRGVKDFRIMTGDDNVASNKFYMKMGCVKVSSGIDIFNSPTSIYKGSVYGTIDLFHNTGV